MLFKKVIFRFSRFSSNNFVNYLFVEEKTDEKLDKKSKNKFQLIQKIKAKSEFVFELLILNV